MWVIMILALVVSIILLLKRSSSVNGPSNIPPSPQINWEKPTSADEHIALFAIFGEAISSFDTAALSVSYSWGAAVDDQVKMTFYGVNNTSVYQNTEVGRYIQSLSTDDWTATCTFSFTAAHGGAPYYFRTNDAVLELVKKYAPHAEVDYQLSNSDFTNIRFLKHDLDKAHLPENISTTVMRAIR